MIASLAGVEGDAPQEHVAPRPAPAADEPSPPPRPDRGPKQRRDAHLRRDLQQSAGQVALDLSSLDHASAAEELALTTARRARVAELESSVSLGPADEGAAGSDAGVRPSAEPQPMFSEPPWGDGRRDVRGDSSWVDGLSRRGRAAGASSRIGAPHSLCRRLASALTAVRSGRARGRGQAPQRAATPTGRGETHVGPDHLGRRGSQRHQLGARRSKLRARAWLRPEPSLGPGVGY